MKIIIIFDIQETYEKVNDWYFDIALCRMRGDQKYLRNKDNEDNGRME